MPRTTALIAGAAALLTAVLLTACRPRPAAYAFSSVPVDGWERGHVLTFPIDTLSHAGTYRLDICLRTSTARPYPFRTLWLEVRRRLGTDGRTQADTLACNLTNAKGDPDGRGVSLLQYDFALDTLSLPAGTAGTITVRHIMSRDILQGISDVGLRLTPI